jgi:hypothetical protein
MGVSRASAGASARQRVVPAMVPLFGTAMKPAGIKQAACQRCDLPAHTAAAGLASAPVAGSCDFLGGR